MTKKLKIRFVKFECTIVMQILEQNGVFPSRTHVKISAVPEFADEDILFLRGSETWSDFVVCVKCFTNNDKRDEYLDEVIGWISEEQFALDRKLEIGEACLFSDDRKDWHSGEYAGKCAKQLGEPRFLALDGDNSLTRWQYVKPLYGALKIDGDIYTWEMEVAE